VSLSLIRQLRRFVNVTSEEMDAELPAGYYKNGKIKTKWNWHVASVEEKCI
jgi:hypothetical protein